MKYWQIALILAIGLLAVLYWCTIACPVASAQPVIIPGNIKSLVVEIDEPIREGTTSSIISVFVDEFGNAATPTRVCFRVDDEQTRRELKPWDCTENPAIPWIDTIEATANRIVNSTLTGYEQELHTATVHFNYSDDKEGWGKATFPVMRIRFDNKPIPTPPGP
jgi:hypothetical protein